MAVKFFGQYLLESNLVSPEALVQAIELQERTNLKFGEMAIAIGYLSKEDIQRAHRAQASKDSRLGDLLVEMGLLTTDQMNEVVRRQKANHLHIGEALVSLDALTQEQLQVHLEAFTQDQAPFVAEHLELPTSVSDSPIWEMAAGMTYKMITRMLGFKFRPAKCRVVTTVDTNFMMAAMDLTGELGNVEVRYVISVSNDVQKEIARAMLREDFAENEPPDVLEDAVMEFANEVCGNIASKASQMGKVLNITPPFTVHPPVSGLQVPAGNIALCFPIHLDKGKKMEVALFLKK